MEELQAVPRVIGQYADLRPVYNIDVPYPGLDVGTVSFGAITLDQMLEKVAAFKAVFNADQERSLLKPCTYVDVGYVLDLDEGPIWCYQLLLHGEYTAPPEETDE